MVLSERTSMRQPAKFDIGREADIDLRLCHLGMT